MVWLGFKKMLAGGFRLISEALVESCGEDVGNTYLALLHQCCGLKGERYLLVLSGVKGERRAGTGSPRGAVCSHRWSCFPGECQFSAETSSAASHSSAC